MKNEIEVIKLENGMSFLKKHYLINMTSQKKKFHYVNLLLEL